MSLLVTTLIVTTIICGIFLYSAYKSDNARFDEELKKESEKKERARLIQEYAHSLNSTRCDSEDEAKILSILDSKHPSPAELVYLIEHTTLGSGMRTKLQQRLVVASIAHPSRKD